MGFGWLLLKLVVGQFYKIGHLVRHTAESFNADGIATSTFIVLWHECREGDAISGIALKASKAHDRKVQMFMPELYDSEVDGAPVRQIEDFLLTRVLHDRFLLDTQGNKTRRELGESDKFAIRGYFVACLRGDAAAAFTALYPRVGECEGILRQLLPKAAGLSRYPGGLKALGSKFPGKEFNYLALGDALQAATLLLESSRARGLALDENWWEAIPKDRFQDIAELRNRLMHFGQFDTKTDCLDFADRALLLFDARDLLISGLEEAIRHATPPTATTRPSDESDPTKA